MTDGSAKEIAWHSRGSTRLASAALFVAGLVPRLYVAIAWTREPVWDGHFYDFGARRIAAGLGYSDDVWVGGALTAHPWSHYPVGYPALLGGAYRLFGHGQYVAPLLNAAIGALLAVVVYRGARFGTTEPRARIAGLLVAAHPGLIAYTALVMTELTAALGIAVAGWLAARTGRWCRRSALAGLVLGLTTLVRPQTVLMAPAIALFGKRRGSRRRRARRAFWAAALASAVAIAVVTPWSLRNCRVMDGCAFVSTNAGWNLAIGSFPGATGRFATLRATDGCRVVTGQVQQDRCWWHRGIHWIRSSPGRWLGLIPRKLSETFDHESYAIGYLAEADPEAWPEPLRDQARTWLSAIHGLLLCVAALGVVAWPRGRRWRPWQAAALGAALLLVGHAVLGAEHRVWPLAVFIPLVALLPLPGAPRLRGIVGYGCFSIATVVLTHALFFGEDRYHIAVTPMVCLLAACALRRSRATAADEISRASRRPAGSASA